MLLRLALSGLCLASFALAQFSSAVQGTVLDPSAAAVASAKVTLKNLRTNITADLQSNSSGFYRFSALGPGDYEVRVDAPGFRSSVVNLALSTGQTRDLNISLEVQSTGESISVTGEAPVPGVSTFQAAAAATRWAESD